MRPSAIVVCDMLHTIRTRDSFKPKFAQLSIDNFRNEKMTIVEKGISINKLSGSIKDVPPTSNPDHYDPFVVSVLFDLPEYKLDELAVYCDTSEFLGYFVDLTIEQDAFYEDLKRYFLNFEFCLVNQPDCKEMIRLVDPANPRRTFIVENSN